MSRSIFRIVFSAILCCMMSHTSFAVQGSIPASGKLVSLSFINTELGQILKSLQHQTGFTFFYSNNVLNEREIRTIKVSNVPLDQALFLLLDNKKFSWNINEKARSVRITGRETKAAVVLPVVVDTTIKGMLTGRVTDQQGEALPGATVKIKGSPMGATTDALGIFKIAGVPEPAVIQVSFTGFNSREIEVDGTKELQVTLTVNPNELKEVEVVSTGYQQLPKERATGSFAFVDNKLLNRSVSTNVLDRLDGVVSGVIFNKQANKVGGISSNGGDPTISVRGRSTIFSNTEPLIILDNFPYEGDPANINPNDIESVTILKDAASASIWGVRAANGVIVLTSRNGRVGVKPKLSFNSNVSISGKPNVYDVPQMTSAEYIQYEKFLFDNGKYNFYLNFLPYVVQSPVIDILENEKKGIINHSQATSQLDKLSAIDNRDDFSRYFLRTSINQQYSLSISGGNESDQYYLSGGFDKNLSSRIPNDYNRFTINGRNNYSLLRNKIDFSSDILFSSSRTLTNPNIYASSYPYESVADQAGNALPVIRDWRQASKNNLSNIGLLDWNYYPLNERFNQGNELNLIDYRINLGLSYKIIKNILSISFNYQFQRGNSTQNILSDESTYATRLKINQFSQIDSSGVITYPIPRGATFNTNTNNYKSNTGRIQFNYNNTFRARHTVNVLGGFEVKDYASFGTTSYLYGYNTDNATNVPVDYFTSFPRQIGGGSDRIPNIYGQTGISDRFISYYLNGGYSYNNIYTVTLSGRRDESNLFGVKANQKAVPLYSVGFAWDISKQGFYDFGLVPYLKLRLTDGFNGNLNKNLSAYTTARTNNSNFYNAPQQVILNPPNPYLTWEKVHVYNAALDFAFKNNVVSGSIELYSKKGENLIGKSPVSAQTGVVEFVGNTADMITRGMDISINTMNINRAIQWSSNILFSMVRDKIITYNYNVGGNSNYVKQNYVNPIVGKPYSALFAYPWAGLDSTGKPQGYLGGKVSTDYGGIINSSNVNDLVYKGTESPTIYGSFRNNFNYQKWSVSFNIVYKLGYYYRRGSFIATNISYRQADFDKRWQKSGDENYTNVPALSYPVDALKDQFYSGSEVLVDKADHIRLQDIQVSYIFGLNKRNHSVVNNIKLYAYANNLGILWRANKHGLDPDYVGDGAFNIPNPKSYSVGVNVNF